MEHESALQQLMLLSEVESLSFAEFVSLKFERRLEAAMAEANGAAFTPEQLILIRKVFKETFAEAPQGKW